MEDSWEISHFGNLAQTAGGDYDGDGVSNADEKLAGTDPNTIQFTAHFADLYVNNRTVTGTCGVQSGVPAQMVVLVDSTNLNAAQWAPYTGSNFSLTLPDADGDHTVLVALRGRTSDFPAAQDWTELTLDRVPPVVVITNPVTATVFKPYLQLQGFVNEPLAEVSYDLTNGLGGFSNEPVAVVGQWFDTNTFDFTTNYFQAYDVPLATNGNSITLRLTDRAGNTTTTNLTVTLDYTGAS